MTDQNYTTYLGWLISQIRITNRRNFDDLFDIMAAKEFVWIVERDDNRVQDALDLRPDYFREAGIKSYTSSDFLGSVSILEVLIALSRRMAFMSTENSDIWARKLLSNLDLMNMSGRIGKTRENRIDERLDRVIWRTYDYDGRGGFFPLRNPKEDQRKVELWMQMNAYIIELDYSSR